MYVDNIIQRGAAPQDPQRGQGLPFNKKAAFIVLVDTIYLRV